MDRLTADEVERRNETINHTINTLRCFRDDPEFERVMFTVSERTFIRTEIRTPHGGGGIQERRHAIIGRQITITLGADVDEEVFL